jgi:hypothetical protein
MTNWKNSHACAGALQWLRASCPFATIVSTLPLPTFLKKEKKKEKRTLKTNYSFKISILSYFKEYLLYH